MFSGSIVWVSTSADAPNVPIAVKHDSSIYQLLQQASVTLDFGAGVKAKQLQAQTIDGAKLDDSARVGHLGAEPHVRITLKPEPAPTTAPSVPGVRTPARARRARSASRPSETAGMASAPRSTRKRRQTATKEIRGPRVVAEKDDDMLSAAPTDALITKKVPGRGSGGLTARICEDYEFLALQEEAAPMCLDDDEPEPEISRDLWEPAAGTPPDVEMARRNSVPAPLPPTAQSPRAQIPKGLLKQIRKGVKLRKTGNLLPSGEHVRVMPMPEPVRSDPKEMEKFHSQQFVRGRLSCRPRRRSCSRPQTPGKAKRARSSSLPRPARTPRAKRRRGTNPQEEEEGVKRRLSGAWRENKLGELRKEELSTMLEERGLSGAGGKASLIRRAEKFAPTLFHSTDIKLGDVEIQTSAGPQVIPERPAAPTRPAAPPRAASAPRPQQSAPARARPNKSSRLCGHGALKQYCARCMEPAETTEAK
eukprot:Hpha_TRINITY_DN15531_c6_g3::TRINITY_DN15531_c6_g3_i1::g.105485::m.105485